MARPFATLVDMFERSCDRFSARALFGTKVAGEFVWTSYGALADAVARTRAGLASLGLRAGDRVALISNNRVEWAACAYAAYGLEVAVVPMYEAQPAEEREFVLRDCGARVVFAANEAIAATVAGAAPRLAEVRHVVRFDAPPDASGSFAGLLRAADARSVPSTRPAPDTTATIIYTSGTTGRPKGVILSHANLISNVNALHTVFPFDPDDRSLSFLPWAHAFGHIELHTLVSMGCSLALNDDVSLLVADLAKVRPTLLVAVPRIFARLHATVHEQLRDRPAPVRALFRAGLRWGTKRARGERLGSLRSAGLRLADALLFSKVRARFGGRLKYVICGGAALGPEIAEFIEALGLTVYEGYGLTETSPIVTANRPGHRRRGSVGQVLPGVALLVDRPPGSPEGEIIVYGPNVMRGYHDRPEERALLPDGGLRTGDVGYVDADGYLFVTGRLKEQFKLDNGKYVMPSPLEEALKASPYITHVVLYGDNKPHCVALVVVDVAQIRGWARAEGIEVAHPTTDPRVRLLLREEIANRSAPFKPFERPLDFALCADEFTPRNGMLTPTLKLRRPVVIGKYRAALEALYPRVPAAGKAARGTANA